MSFFCVQVSTIKNNGTCIPAINPDFLSQAYLQSAVYLYNADKSRCIVMATCNTAAQLAACQMAATENNFTVIPAVADDTIDAEFSGFNLITDPPAIPSLPTSTPILGNN